MKPLPAFFGSLIGLAGPVVTIAVLQDRQWIAWIAFAAACLLAYVVVSCTPRSSFGEGLRGTLIGLNAGANGALAFLLADAAGIEAAAWPAAIGTSAITYIAVFRPVSRSEIYQGFIGWLNFALPMSWLVLGLGASFFALNLLGHALVYWIARRAYFRVEAMRVDWKTGTFFQKGGFISNLNYRNTAFNMGNFAFVDRASTRGWHIDHEAGHSLNLAAFGSVFHLVGAVDENVLGRGANAYAELIAESNHSSGSNVIPMWS